MTLGEMQQNFTQMVAKLIEFAYTSGYGLTFGEAYRTPEQAALDAKGIIHSVRNVDDLDEAPSSYKDIDVVMEEQKDLVDIVMELTPLAVVKG